MFPDSGLTLAPCVVDFAFCSPARPMIVLQACAPECHVAAPGRLCLFLVSQTALAVLLCIAYAGATLVTLGKLLNLAVKKLLTAKNCPPSKEP